MTAFDTIDNLSSDCLKHCYGIDGVVLKWVESYRDPRKQCIKIEWHFLDAFQLPCWIPQGSVFGPLLFTLCTTPLSTIVSKFSVTHHLSSLQIIQNFYLELDSRNFTLNITELVLCLEAIQVWMGNKLKSRTDRTEFILTEVEMPKVIISCKSPW